MSHRDRVVIGCHLVLAMILGTAAGAGTGPGIGWFTSAAPAPVAAHASDRPLTWEVVGDDWQVCRLGRYEAFMLAAGEHDVFWVWAVRLAGTATEIDGYGWRVEFAEGWDLGEDRAKREAEEALRKVAR